jgi:7-cyano-7-deazaguanine synthase in queuosine biosynthesis
MLEQTVVVDDCWTPQRPDIRNVRLMDTPHAVRNFDFNFDRLVQGLSQQLSPHQLDWLWIAGSLYAADVACQRGTDLGWTRRIELHVPVSDPARWAPFEARLEDAFGRLTYDQLKLTFHPRTVTPSPPRQSRTPSGDAEAIALLSGGLDSFAGGLELVASSPATFFVSHAGAPVTRTAQLAVEPILKQRAAQAQFAAFRAQRRRDFGPREGSERSRTMLFLACAGLLSAALDVQKIYLNENGVLAVHLPLTEARIGSLSTRTASPSFVDSFGDLMSEALEKNLVVHNLLVNRTKPDVVELAVAQGSGNDLARTISCWSIGHTRRHCGYCAPCMIRRISTGIHGVQDVSYDHDTFGDEAIIASHPFARDNLVQLLDTLKGIATATDEDLELDYPELLNGGRQITPAEAREVHKRWARQANAYLSTQPVPARFL